MSKNLALLAFLRDPARDADVYELVVTQGIIAQDSLQCVLQNVFSDEKKPFEPPSWLVEWAETLTSSEIRRITAQRDAEWTVLREDVNGLLDDDPKMWTPDEAEHASMAQLRISAVNLVLECLKVAQAQHALVA